MNLETVITKQQGIEAMQYVIANVSDDSFMDHVAHYLYDHYKFGYVHFNSQYKEDFIMSEGISTMIDIWIGSEAQTIKAQPAFILTDKERTSIGHQFYRTLEESKHYKKA